MAAQRPPRRPKAGRHPPQRGAPLGAAPTAPPSPTPGIPASALMADAEHVAADAVATPDAPAPGPASTAPEPAVADAPASGASGTPSDPPAEAKAEESPSEPAVVAHVEAPQVEAAASSTAEPDKAAPATDSEPAAAPKETEPAAEGGASAAPAESPAAGAAASAEVPVAEAADAPEAPRTPAPAALAVSLSDDKAEVDAEGDLSAELAGAGDSPLRRSPSGKRLSSPASPTASPSVAEHDFSRKADVTRIPSREQQPPEGGGLRMWVTRAEEWPPQARRARALLRDADDAEEALSLAKQRDCPPDQLDALDAAAKKARGAAPDPDSIDWRSANYAAYSLAEQIAAVQGVAEREHSPAVAAEGWLSRIKAKEKTVKARYFVLTPRALVYFASAAHARVSSSGYLLAEWDFPNLPGRFTMRTHGARIWLRDVTGIRLNVADRSLALSRPASEGGEVVLRASTEEECREWCDAIEELRSAEEDGPVHDDEAGSGAASSGGAAAAAAAAAGDGGSDAAAAEGGAAAATAAEGSRRASTEGKDADNAAAPPTAEGAGGRTRRPTLLGRMFGRAPKAELSEAEKAKADEEKARADEEKAKAEAERKAKANAERHARHERTEAAEEERARKAEERRLANAEAARQREVDRKKAVILAKQHHAEEAKRRAEMSLEAVLKLKAETEARFRPRFWRAPKPGPDATEEEISMTPTLHTVVEDRFRSYLEDRDGNPLALMSGWMTKDAESAVSMGVPKDRFFVLTPYFLAYFCSEADAGISATGHMTGRAMGEKPRRLMRLGARIGLEHIVTIKANTEEDETDDVLGDLDTGAVLAAERGDEQAAEAIAREAKERSRAARAARAGAGAGADADADADADGASGSGSGGGKDGKGAAAATGAGAGAAAAAAASSATPQRKGKGRASIPGRRYSSLMASTDVAGGASPSKAGRQDRGDSLSGTKLANGRCITPPKPRTKPPVPDTPPPGLAARVMIATTRARLGSNPMETGAMPRVESATLNADLVDRALRLQCHKVAYRDEWVRMLKVWQLWWRKRQEQLTLEQWSSAAAFRHSQAAMSMTKEQALARRSGSTAGGAQARRAGGRRFVGGRGRGLPAK
ncbi:hypothetical protein FNF29_05209 [Cafeteria roenbergensis]|uniref:PH domain-containing protein n=1 Tax=Cafeteria roenbergensis TaxID=33653 RepID=A0A5A8CDK7_CAFRO|nr:hypothetical protein FNF29_05209 [Cafeteria roenbergensis]|eukprot:KAA0150634.1 hypothetical protein FNF29_05209 [Cafeteria roenbergensis]